MSLTVDSAVAVVGADGTLAQAVATAFSNYKVSVFSRHNYDLRNVGDVELLATQLNTFDVIVYCPGVFVDDAWNTFTINATAPAHLCNQLAQANCQAHVILVGSHSGMWTSWPNIDLPRLWYNLSKQSLTAIATGLSHSGNTKMTYTAFNPCKFKSSMSNYSGVDALVIADAIKSVAESPAPPVVYEMDLANVR